MIQSQKRAEGRFELLLGFLSSPGFENRVEILIHVYLTRNILDKPVVREKRTADSKQKNEDKIAIWADNVRALAETGTEQTKCRAYDMLAKHYGCYEADNRQKDREDGQQARLTAEEWQAIAAKQAKEDKVAKLINYRDAIAG